MKYYLGIDGGGTKTEILLIDENGYECARIKIGGSSYRALGTKGTAALFEEGIERCLGLADANRRSLAGFAAGVPCFGEDKTADEAIKKLMMQRYPNVPFYLCNDAEVGWAGSLALKPGINIVAGTGSIAFGKNSTGKSVRCGGWSTFYGDEGSCYWLGRKTIELFSKQMDGRLKKDRLYEILMDSFHATSPEIVINTTEDYTSDRSKVAALQKYLLMAADAGDSAAAAAYREAADELGSMAYGAAKQLMIPGEQLNVTLSGGLIYAKKYIFDRFLQWVNKFNGHFVQSEMFPVQGAALLAVQKFSELDIEQVKTGMRQTKEEEL